MTETVPLIGIVGNDVPRQLVLATGTLPHRITGSWTGGISAEASELLGAADAVTARILTELLESTGEFDGLVICNDDQSHLRLFYALRATGFPLPLLLIDFPAGRSAPAQRFAEVQYRALADFCGRLSGRRADAGTLAAAADDERALGRALGRLRDARRALPSRCSGTRALELLLAASRSHPSDAVALIDAAIDDGPDAAATGIRVHMTGSSHPDPLIYRALEAHGCVVVGEDHDTGDLAWLGDAVDAGSLDAAITALVQARFARVSASPGAYSSDRAALTAAMASDARADAVVAFIRELDEAPLWDLPDQAEALRAQNLRFEVSARVGAADSDSTARELAEALTRTEQAE